MICTSIGDSIAVGYGQVAGCSINARVGASSGEIARLARGSGFCVISSGSNDPNNPSLRSNLIKTRNKLDSCVNVVWILPQNKRAASIVQSVANEFGDAVVSFKAGRDGVHPNSYSSLSKRVSSARRTGG